MPGIDFTNDPMLQGRNFSYLDTQLSRLGSVNFNQLPINRPLKQVINNQRDGHMQMNIHTDKLNYCKSISQHVHLFNNLSLITYYQMIYLIAIDMLISKSNVDTFC